MSTLADLLANPEPIPEQDARYARLLRDLQSNILTPHSKQRAVYFFLRFYAPEGARRLASMLASGDIPGLGALRMTSESEIRSKRDKERKLGVPRNPMPFTVNFLLTAQGYHFLGIQRPEGTAFRDGMAKRKLGDPGPGAAKYQGLHALVIVAFDPALPDSRLWPAELVEFRRRLEEQAEIAGGEPEEGEVLRSRDGNSIEPFGFHDGISQPAFYLEDFEKRVRRAPHSAARGHLPIPREIADKRDNFTPLGLVLCADRGSKSPDACGSFFVFRKLRQDVNGFYDQAKRLAREAKPPRDATQMAAQLVGRTPEGVPLERDAEGRVCPFHAHVRKVNPRGDVPNAARHRIVRRGLAYGSRIWRTDEGMPLFDANGRVILEDPEAQDERGLLFLCAQADIESQFEQLQSWANDPNFRWLSGADPLIGNRPNNRLSLIEEGERGPRPGPVKHAYQPVVEFLGGEYFFAPSISFLRELI